MEIHRDEKDLIGHDLFRPPHSLSYPSGAKMAADPRRFLWKLESPLKREEKLNFLIVERLFSCAEIRAHDIRSRSDDITHFHAV